jgi:hypothetical protein
MFDIPDPNILLIMCGLIGPIYRLVDAENVPTMINELYNVIEVFIIMWAWGGPVVVV